MAEVIATVNTVDEEQRPSGSTVQPRSKTMRDKSRHNPRNEGFPTFNALSILMVTLLILFSIGCPSEYTTKLCIICQYVLV